MKLAIPVWNGRVSPVFDSARRLLVVEVEEDRVVRRQEHALAAEIPQARVSALANLNVEVLVCGAVSRPLANLITASGIRLVSFVAGDVEEVVKASLSGALPAPTFMMPGCRCRRRRQRRAAGRSSS